MTKIMTAENLDHAAGQGRTGSLHLTGTAVTRSALHSTLLIQPMVHEAYTLFFRELANDKVALVGGKNASLGEMFNQLKDKGISVPDGFATTAAAYGLFLDENRLRETLTELLASLDTKEFTNLPEIDRRATSLVHGATLPAPVATVVRKAYRQLQAGHSDDIQVAVRSSTTAEDLPTPRRECCSDKRTPDKHDFY